MKRWCAVTPSGLGECSDPHFYFIKGPLNNRGYTSGPAKRHFNLWCMEASVNNFIWSKHVGKVALPKCSVSWHFLYVFILHALWELVKYYPTSTIFDAWKYVVLQTEDIFFRALMVMLYHEVWRYPTYIYSTKIPDGACVWVGVCLWVSLHKGIGLQVIYKWYKGKKGGVRWKPKGKSWW